VGRPEPGECFISNVLAYSAAVPDLLHHEPVRQWPIGLDSWIIQDGNYPDFGVGQQAEFAVEFFLPEPNLLDESAQPSLDPVEDAAYDMRGRVVAILDRVWVLDCGLINLYQEIQPPEGVNVGDTVSGRGTLGIDPFFYFERLHLLEAMPPLVYTWHIDEIRMQTAPFIQTGNMLARDPTKLGWRQIERTDAWHDDDGRAGYLMICSLLEVPPKRSSVTAT
jgi:hypothetical protein